MSIIRTRNIADPLSALEQFVQQSEKAGAGLISLVAGTVQGVPFNVVTLAFEPKTLPPIKLQKVTDPIDTNEQQMAVQKQLVAGGLTPLFFAPLFDANQQVNVAACRTTAVDGFLMPGEPLDNIISNIPTPSATATGSHPFTTEGSRGSFRGSSSLTSGLNGTEKSLSDGSVIIEGQETLSAVRGAKDFGNKTAKQRRVKIGNIQTVEQSQYSWLSRTLPNTVLMENFNGFPSDVPILAGKATRFGKNDHEDEGTGSEFLKVVQTNSEVFGASVKRSRLVATFGSELSASNKLLGALVEIVNPATSRFARVPIVDVGPAEHLSAEIDLTWALDQFLKTEGSTTVQFRIVA
jgi:hypothetical protein